MSGTPLLWGAFIAVLAVMFVLDLGILNRGSREVSLRQAAAWTAVWVGLALAFDAAIWLRLGPEKALEFLTGYLIEESLSVDNLFVFIMIFSYFHVGRSQQPKILKWGIFGALVMRALFIVAGIGLIERFRWAVFVFGGILILTAFRMSFGSDTQIDPERNLAVRIVRRFFPVAPADDRFFAAGRGRVVVTPLFLTLLVVESSDLLFAVDSIPAVLAITRDPFIVYTSNVFAILGLRSLYYLLAGVVDLFVYLKYGISVILAFVGVKMTLSEVIHVGPWFSLAVIAAVLAVSVGLSVTVGRKSGRQP